MTDIYVVVFDMGYDGQDNIVAFDSEAEALTHAAMLQADEDSPNFGWGEYIVNTLPCLFEAPTRVVEHRYTGNKTANTWTHKEIPHWAYEAVPDHGHETDYQIVESSLDDEQAFARFMERWEMRGTTP